MVLAAPCSDPMFNKLVLPPERLECEEKGTAETMCVELTSRCAGSCSFCFASSTDAKDSQTLPTELVRKLIDEAVALGMRNVLYTGGDPLLHPDWFDLILYAVEKGMTAGIDINVMIDRKTAKKLCYLSENGLSLLVTHLDTLRQEVYDQVHTVPRTLERKICGFRYL